MDFVEAVGAFVRVAQSQSFSRAAAEMEATQSRISKQVAMLERRLGARLLNRTTRRVRLTEEGVQFLMFAQQMLDGLADVEARIGQAKALPSGLVKIGCPSAFARRFLAQSAGRILARHPSLRLDIVTGDLSEDLVAQGIDMAIRFGTVSGGMIARRIGSVARVAVATPRYLAEAGTPATPDDLAAHACLIYLNPNAGPGWAFSPKDGALKIEVSGRLQSNSADVIKAACLAGTGIALMPEWLFHDEIASGAVQSLLQAHRPDGLPVVVAYASRSFLPPKIRIVLGDIVHDLRAVLRPDPPDADQ